MSNPYPCKARGRHTLNVRCTNEMVDVAFEAECEAQPHDLPRRSNVIGVCSLSSIEHDDENEENSALNVLLDRWGDCKVQWRG